MPQKITVQELSSVIQKALKAKHPVSLDDSAGTLKEWDSLGQLAILVAIDKELNGKASGIKKLASCQSVRALADTLKKNGFLK